MTLVTTFGEPEESSLDPFDATVVLAIWLLSSLANVIPEIL